MGVEGLFKDAPVLRWSHEEKANTWSAVGPRGISARLYLSAISGRWVLTVEVPPGFSRTRQLLAQDEFRTLAEEWIREAARA
ncbi:hypothetical protein [Xanthobacter sp. 126]|uniref:hypothetical protein n=1 Tax=Xanthobacter sp. 126 TaxID=1131814 RepID=UPI00045EA68C|nr:hypothetical protein [Xanthobacter sp. 126]